MTDCYVVKSRLGADELPSWPCNSEKEALDKSAALFDEHGPELHVEIFLNDVPPPLHPARQMAQWNKGRKLVKLGTAAPFKEFWRGAVSPQQRGKPS